MARHDRNRDTHVSAWDEEYATLAAVREAPAHGMYLRWGWKPISRFTTPPYCDAMNVSLATQD